MMHRSVTEPLVVTFKMAAAVEQALLEMAAAVAGYADAALDPDLRADIPASVLAELDDALDYIREEARRLALEVAADLRAKAAAGHVLAPHEVVGLRETVGAAAAKIAVLVKIIGEVGIAPGLHDPAGAAAVRALDAALAHTACAQSVIGGGN